MKSLVSRICLQELNAICYREKAKPSFHVPTVMTAMLKEVTWIENQLFVWRFCY